MKTSFVQMTLSASKTLAVFLAFSFTTVTVHADWSVDFSRRAKAIRESDLDDAGQAPEFRTIDSRAFERQPASSTDSSAAQATAFGAGAKSFASAKVMNPTVPSEQIGKKAPAEKAGVFDQIFDAGEPVQEIVILNTDKGFVPNTIRVRKNSRYKITVVNVNEKEKNVSFILDGFSEHHATYFAKVKSFALQPNKEGVFSFQSPETAAEGKLVVYNPPITVRTPASERAAANEK